MCIYYKMKTKNIDFMNNIELKEMKKPTPKVSVNMIKPFFVLSAVGTRGVGKTTNIVKLIIELMNEGALKSPDIYIISSTYYSNPVFHNIPRLKKKNILTNISQSNEFMTKLEKEFMFTMSVRKSIRKKYTKKEYREWYETIIDKINYDDEDEEEYINDLTNLEYLHLKLNSCENEEYFYSYIPHFLIFVDDGFNTNIYSDSKDNVFKNFFIKHRHYNTSLICATQSFTGGLNKSLRANVSHFMIFRQSKKKLHEIYDEVLDEVIKDEEQFIDIFQEITKNKYNFILIDKDTHNDEFILRKNFNEIIIINSANNIDDETRSYASTKENDKKERIEASSLREESNKKTDSQENIKSARHNEYHKLDSTEKK